jgi:hypothetical protein
MKIRLKVSYGGAKAGDVIDCREAEALALINSGKGRNAEGEVAPAAELKATNPKGSSK